MKRITTMMMALLLLAAPMMGQGSRVLTDTIHSKVLGAPRAYNVYLPAGFDENPGKKYPVLYLLHGMWDNNECWATKAGLQEMADMLTRSGEIEPMVILTPDAGGGAPNEKINGYFNVEDWPYETFFFEEFIPQMEQKYRVIGDRRHRAVAGLSMGGGGTTVYAQKHPDMFAAAYAISALMDWPDDWLQDPDPLVTKTRRSVRQNSCIDFVNNADDATKERLRSVDWFVDCGDDDFLLDMNIDFYRAMRAAGIPCQFRVRDGQHQWEYWHTALYQLLPFANRAFRRID